MHETLIAKRLLSVVLERAKVLKARRKFKVYGWIADAEALTLDALRFHFAAHAKDTVAVAHLDLKLTQVRAYCNDSGSEYIPDHGVTFCPQCGTVNNQLQSEVGVGLNTLDYE